MGNTIRVRQKTVSGSVIEYKVWSWAPRGRAVSEAKLPKPRFQNDEERRQHSLLISKRKFARLINANCSPSSLKSTLTFDNRNEVHTFEEARQIRENFIRRLLYKYPDAVIFLVMGRGEHTSRIHFHMISNDIPEEYIRKQWKYGKIVEIEHLREHNWYENVDHGQDYTALANYMFEHWTEEQGGHRWRMTKNVKQPEVEKPEEIKREYSEQKPPKAPKGYILVESKSNQYGYLYFKYIKEPPKIIRRKKKEPRGGGFEKLENV